MEEQEEKKLPAGVAANFDLAPGHGVGEYHFKNHIVRLDRISPEKAAELVKDGFPYLVAKEAPAADKKAKAALPEASK